MRLTVIIFFYLNICHIFDHTSYDAGVKEYEHYYREQIQPKGHFAGSSREISMLQMNSSVVCARKM